MKKLLFEVVGTPTLSDASYENLKQRGLINRPLTEIEIKKHEAIVNNGELSEPVITFKEVV